VKSLKDFNQLLSLLLYLFRVGVFVIGCDSVLHGDLHFLGDFLWGCSFKLLTLFFIFFLLFFRFHSFEVSDIHAFRYFLDFNLRVLRLNLCGEDFEELLELLTVNKLEEANIPTTFLEDTFDRKIISATRLFK
jgi:hypothetical protein